MSDRHLCEKADGYYGRCPQCHEGEDSSPIEGQEPDLDLCIADAQKAFNEVEAEVSSPAFTNLRGACLRVFQLARENLSEIEEVHGEFVADMNDALTKRSDEISRLQSKVYNLEQDNERLRLALARAQDGPVCGVCAGNPFSVEGGCVCGGTGRQEDEVVGLRREVHLLRGLVAETQHYLILQRERADRAEKLYDGVTAQEQAVTDLMARVGAILGIGPNETHIQAAQRFIDGAHKLGADLWKVKGELRKAQEEREMALDALQGKLPEMYGKFTRVQERMELIESRARQAEAARDEMLAEYNEAKTDFYALVKAKRTIKMADATIRRRTEHRDLYRAALERIVSTLMALDSARLDPFSDDDSDVIIKLVGEDLPEIKRLLATLPPATLASRLYALEQTHSTLVDEIDSTWTWLKIPEDKPALIEGRDRDSPIVQVAEIADVYEQAVDDCFKLRSALQEVDRVLRVPAAEYVPSIQNAFDIIDAALNPQPDDDV